MPSIDFTTIDDIGEPIPEGKYRLQITDIEETATQYGDEMWRLTLTVLDGKYEGQRVRDNMVFSAKAYPRVKLMCSRLGIDVAGTLDLTPEMLLDKTFLGTVVVRSYEDGDGNEKKTNGLAFDGYEADPEGVPQGTGDENAAF
jgi:hypothetical protein